VTVTPIEGAAPDVPVLSTTAGQHARGTNLTRVVLACFLGLTVGASPILIYTMGVFLGPLTAEFGWSRAVYFLPLMIGGLVGALAIIAIGAAADRQGVRPWLLAGIVAFGVLNLGLAAMNGSIWVYGVLMVGVVLANCAHGPLLYTKAVSEWSTSRPAFAIAIALAGTAVGAIVTPPLATWLVGEWGWRAARAGLGVLVLVVALPPVWLFVRPPPPELRSRSVDLVSHTEASLQLSQVFRSWRFAQIGIGVFAAAAALNGILTNLPVIVTDRGLSPAVAAGALSSFAIAQIFGRLLSGAALDRVKTSMIGASWFLVALPGALLVGFSTATPMILFGAILLGLSLGSELETAAYYTLRFFGVSHYGAVYGALMAIFSVGATSGPLLLGFFYDRTGHNEVGVLIATGLLALTVVLFLTLGRYRFALRSHEPDASDRPLVALGQQAREGEKNAPR
jgi:MFS family permease